jgi:ergothioneine biosynthesis protein EgtB
MTLAPSSLDESRASLLRMYEATRAATESLAAPLSAEDQILQSMPSASPTKWHLAHTSRFFEKAVLEPAGVGPCNARYAELFNSYYEAFGPRHPRPQRGLLSRPSLEEVHQYRRHVDAGVRGLFRTFAPRALSGLAPLIELGIAHEEQHQELILTDILHALSHNPLGVVYAPPTPVESETRSPARPARFVAFEGGVHAIGSDPRAGFCFDNESSVHKVWVEPFELADRLVTHGELKAFMREGGYSTPSLWLSDGLDFIREHAISAPLYVDDRDGELYAYGLHGTRVLEDDEPVCHLSYYEADALARYLGARLPTEVEWEIAAQNAPTSGHFVESGLLHPCAAPRGAAIAQLFGDVWEWTASSYEPYPGFAVTEGALGEYNGKFMINQRVLRGGSCLTPGRHIRASYRNFWHPATRFQMTGLRLARRC